MTIFSRVLGLQTPISKSVKSESPIKMLSCIGLGLILMLFHYFISPPWLSLLPLKDTKLVDDTIELIHGPRFHQFFFYLPA